MPRSPRAWVAAFVLSACAGPSDAEIAADLFEEIQGWESWAEKAPWTGLQASSDGTHGTFVQITFNELAAGAWGGELPPGSISVKRGYDSDDVASARDFITVMKKIEGYDPDGGDWFWARIGVDGTVGSQVGRAAFCSGCHLSGTDYLRTVTDRPSPRCARRGPARLLARASLPATAKFGI